MPQFDGSTPTGKNVKSARISIPRNPDSDVVQYIQSGGYRFDLDSDTSSIPPMLRLRLRELFAQIEREFENLYAENAHLQEKIDTLSEKLERESVVFEKQGFDSVDFDSGSKSASKQKSSAGSSQKLKTAHKLRAQTSKIVSSFKGPTVSCTLVQEFSGHRDGVWDVAVARPGQPLIGTASADHSACIWSVETGRCLLQYQGHNGSVNSIRFHPSRDVVLTASGDEKAHIWQAALTWEDMKPPSVEEEETEVRGDRDDYADDGELKELSPVLRTPLRELNGHSNAVIAADWLPGGDQLITASWDRTANLFDVETGEILQTLCGHDQGLTHTSSHHSQRLVVTSSRDTTFRLWDFREAIHSVSVFQGHTDTVTCAVFSRDDKVVSGSDDRTVKVWDMRNMRSPLATIRSDSAANRLAVSASGVIAIPHDNRNVRLFDLSGNRIARLPRTSRQGHRRMVCCVTWGDENSGYPSNFYSCGFDRLVLGWSIHPCKEN